MMRRRRFSLLELGAVWLGAHLGTRLAVDPRLGLVRSNARDFAETWRRRLTAR
jgi:hypothetical protein